MISNNTNHRRNGKLRTRQGDTVRAKLISGISKNHDYLADQIDRFGLEDHPSLQRLMIVGKFDAQDSQKGKLYRFQSPRTAIPSVASTALETSVGSQIAEELPRTDSGQAIDEVGKQLYSQLIDAVKDFVDNSFRQFIDDTLQKSKADKIALIINNQTLCSLMLLYLYRLSDRTDELAVTRNYLEELKDLQALFANGSNSEVVVINATLNE